MEHRSLERLALSVIILLLALEQSVASDYEGNGRKRCLMNSKTRNYVSLLNVAFDGANAAYAKGRKNILGRKMLQEVNAENLYVSRKDTPSVLDENSRKSQMESDRFNYQSKQRRLSGSYEGKTSRSGSDEVVFPKHDYFGEKRVDHSKSFVEAADEVANLMRKDYNGANRPGRRSPINNHEPTN